MNNIPESNYRRCSECHKVFKSRVATDEHIRNKHKGNGRRIAVNEEYLPDYEPSMAELFIEGEINRAMGIQNEEWLEEML